MILIQEQSPKIATSAIKDFGKFSFRHNAVWLALSQTVGSPIPLSRPRASAAYEYAIEKLHDNTDKFSTEAGSCK